jgi:hypothetical protein
LENGTTVVMVAPIISFGFNDYQGAMGPLSSLKGASAAKGGIISKGCSHRESV